MSTGMNDIETTEFVFRIIGKESPMPDAPITIEEQDTMVHFVPEGWTSSPQGTYSEDLVELVSARIKLRGATKFSKFLQPIVWTEGRATK